MSTSDGYGRVSRANHWIAAIAVIGLLASGMILGFDLLDREASRSLRGTHQGIGALFFAFALWRVAWQTIQGFPPANTPLPSWQERAARLTHYALLVLLLVMPASGLGRALFRGRDLDVLGLLTLPAFGEVPAMARLAAQVHYIAAWMLLFLVSLHVAAALKHHFVDKDATVRRMISGASQRRNSDAGTL